MESAIGEGENSRNPRSIAIQVIKQSDRERSKHDCGKSEGTNPVICYWFLTFY